MYSAAEKAGIETPNLCASGHDFERGRHSLERKGTKNERVGSHGSLKLRPRRRRSGMEPVDKAGEQSGLRPCAKQRALKFRSVQIIKVNLELSWARLSRSFLRSAAGREGQIPSSLQRA